MLYTKAILERKVNDHNPKLCAIEKVIELGGTEFDHFSRNLMDDYDFIRDNKDLMCYERDGAARCLLMVGKDRQDGILVESVGYDCARYSSFVPNARDFLNAQLTPELSAQMGITPPVMKLKDLIKTPLEDVHLVHVDEEIDLATIVELKSDTLTDAGKLEWADVLNADVHRIYQGGYGLEIELGGVLAERLSEFSNMLAGYCLNSDYEKWVAGELDEPTQTMKM